MTKAEKYKEKILKSTKFKQKDLAEILNITEAHLSNVLNGKAVLTIQMDKRINFYIKKLEL